MPITNCNVKGRGKRKVIYKKLVLKYAAEVTGLRVDDPEVCVTLGSQHPAGPVLGRYHDKERIQQPNVIAKELKLVLYFLPNELKYPFLSCPWLSELKDARVENPKKCALPPHPAHGVALLTFFLSPSALWGVDGLSQLGKRSDFCLSLLSSPHVLDSAHPDSESCLAGAQARTGQSLHSLWWEGVFQVPG